QRSHGAARLSSLSLPHLLPPVPVATSEGTGSGGTSSAPEHPAPLSPQVGTNGVISSQDFPRETQYVDDDFPTDFPVIAPFLADLDTSGDRGNIYYRQDDSRDVLDQAVGYIQAGFPRSAATFVPTNAFIATWEEVGAYQELSQDTEPSKKVRPRVGMVTPCVSQIFYSPQYPCVPADDAENPGVSPCHDGSHTCEAPARCQPGVGTEYACECPAGYRGDGRGCRDVDECTEGLGQCGPFSVCLNAPGSYRCECRGGYQPAGDGQACVPLAPPSDPCEDGRHPCAPGDRARCLSRGDGRATCECLPGYTGDGIHCSDVDECAESPCHPAAICYNTPGSFSCRCRPGYAGDGFQCTFPSLTRLTPCQHERMYPREVPPLGDGHVPQCDEQGRYRPLQCHGSSGHCWCVDAAGQEIAGTRTAPGTTPPRCGSPEPTERPPSMCERWRQSLLEHYGGSPRRDQYVPQCDPSGDFTPLQCHGDSGYCWCVEQSGREISGTRSEPGTTPPCLPSVAPPSVRPEPRPDVSPPATGTFLLYAQGQQIGYLPLNGTRLHKEAAKTLLSLHGSIVVGIDYDCRERMIYWTDVAGRSISRAGLEPGSEPETIISSGLISPEGLAVDHLRRAMFWTDSGLDRIERARLDGSERRVLFDSELVNPRAIAVDPIRGNLYWTDWNREAPKIETSTVNGANRRVLVHTDIGLPNGLTFDPFSKLLCWADAGTKHLECTFPDGTGRRLIQSNLNYPFSIISYANHFYHTDWRRDGVIAVNKETGSFTDEYLPEQRSHLYGITAVYPYCPGGKTHPNPIPL
uniref:Nidogen 2 n=1 Tax=Serinus canaria TaxID=9135 RepID=A0A8C9L469_SERCA